MCRGEVLSRILLLCVSQVRARAALGIRVVGTRLGRGSRHGVRARCVSNRFCGTKQPVFISRRCSLVRRKHNSRRLSQLRELTSPQGNGKQHCWLWHLNDNADLKLEQLRIRFIARCHLPATEQDCCCSVFQSTAAVQKPPLVVLQP